MLKERGIIQPVPNGEVNFYHYEFFHLFGFISSWCALSLPTTLIFAWLFIVRPIFINTSILCGSRSYPYYKASSVSVQDKSKLSCAEQARLSYLVRWGLPTVSHKKNFPKSHIISTLLTKLAQSRWLIIGLILFFAGLLTLTPSWSINMQKKNLANISHLLKIPREERGISKAKIV